MLFEKASGKTYKNDKIQSIKRNFHGGLPTGIPAGQHA